MRYQEIQKLIQPNDYSCVATCLAMLLNVSFEEIIYEIGHDGSEIISNDEYPFNHRGFSYIEAINVLMKYKKYPITMLYMDDFGFINPKICQYGKASCPYDRINR